MQHMQHAVAVQHRHHNIADDKIGLKLHGQFHAFLTMGRLLPEANKLVGEIVAWMKQRAV